MGVRYPPGQRAVQISDMTWGRITPDVIRADDRPPGGLERRSPRARVLSLSWSSSARALSLLTLACGRGEAQLQGPSPQPGMVVLGLLRAPFEGEYPTDNVFDHTPGARPPGEGELLGSDGQRAIGTRGHRGHDWPLPEGTPVLAPADGEVVTAGVVAPFSCPLLGRVVDDQRAVVIRHVAADGSVWETASHHLSEVSVTAGAQVRAGEAVGRAGASGCARGPHLHFQVERVDGDVRRPMDPFGWSGHDADPWSGDEPSPWLWAPGAAPPWVREHVVGDPPADQAVAVRAIRYQGWRDERAPEQESVELLVGPGEVGGWAVEGPDGLRWSFPEGEVWADAGVVRLRSGRGRDTPTVRYWGTPAPVWPDSGGVLRLVRPDGSAAQTVRYGLGSRRVAPPSGPSGGPSCLPGLSDCVLVGAPGPVASPAWSPDGERLAAVVGAPGGRRLVVGRPFGPEARLDVVTDLADAANPRWLTPEIVVFDARDEQGARQIAYVVPGLEAAWAFRAEALGGPAEVRDARGGLLLFSVRRPAAADLFVWRPGDAAPRALTLDRRDELGGRIDPSGQHVVFAAAGEAWRAPVAGGPAVSLGPVIDPDVLVASWGEGAVWVRGGTLFGADAAGVRPLAEGVRPWPAVGPPVVVAGAPWALRENLVAVQAAELREVPTVPENALAADAWSDGSSLRVAYIVAEGGHRPAFLGVLALPEIP